MQLKKKQKNTQKSLNLFIDEQRQRDLQLKNDQSHEPGIHAAANLAQV